MSDIQRLVVGDTTEKVLKIVFDHRIALESNDSNLNTISRASKIKDLKGKVVSFIKRNPNSYFKVIIPEFKSDKSLELSFNNFAGSEEETSAYEITVNDNFVEAEVLQKVKLGKDITLKIKAE